MKIVYVSGLMPQKRFYELFKAGKAMPGQQVQKYHRLLTRGLAQNGIEVMALSLPPVNRANFLGLRFKGEQQTEEGVQFRLLPVWNVPVIKHFGVLLNSFGAASRELQSKKDTAVVLDILNLSVSLGAALAARLRKKKIVGIVTDLPEMMDTNNRGLGARLSARLIKLCTHYVFLTEAMNERLNPKNKPYAVIEGQVDQALDQEDAPLPVKDKPRVFLYAGEISRRYGLEMLAEGFLEANIKGAALHYYGWGDYAEGFARLCAKHDNLYYAGVCPNEQVVEAEKRATLLINPRPTKEAFTRYSFPSKNMEYMVSGTPVLTTKLPGMPDSYDPYVFLLEEETKEGVAEALSRIAALPEEVLQKRGQAARRFVLLDKNNVQAAARIIRLLKEDKP